MACDFSNYPLGVAPHYPVIVINEEVDHICVNFVWATAETGVVYNEREYPLGTSASVIAADLKSQMDSTLSTDTKNISILAHEVYKRLEQLYQVEIPATPITKLTVKAGATIGAGDLLRITGYDGITPIVSPTTALNQVIVGVANVGIANTSIGEIIKEGKVSAKVASDTIIGDKIGSSATVGTGTRMLATSILGLFDAAAIDRLIAASAGRGIVALTNHSSGFADVFIS